MSEMVGGTTEQKRGVSVFRKPRIVLGGTVERDSERVREEWAQILVGRQKASRRGRSKSDS